MPHLSIPLYRIGHLRSVGIPSDSGVDTYAATVDGLPGGPPLVHYRLGEALGPTMVDRKAGARHGTYFGNLAFNLPGLPQNSNTAVDFRAAGYAQAPHDAGLVLPAVTISFWFKMSSLPFGDEDPAVPDRFVLLSKGQVGSFNGDLDIWVDVAGGVVVQFQTATSAIPLGVGVVTDGTIHHLLVRADNTGFDAALDGIFVAKKTNYTGALANAQPLLLGAAPWHFSPGGAWPANGFFADAIIDEVAIYDRVLTNLEGLTLAQYNASPIARPDDFTVQPLSSNILNVVQNDTYQGAKAALGVQITAQPPHGTAAVRSNKDIDFNAGSIEQDGSFSYRITDGFGTSAPAVANVRIQSIPPPGSDGDDGQGGVLVYRWSPLASWIDGVPFSSRSFDNCLNIGRFKDPTATAGSSRLPASFAVGGGGNVRDCCYNRAPDGSPALEIGSKGGGANPGGIDFTAVMAGWPKPGPNPKHLRIVCEVWLSGPGDPTTYRDQGIFPSNATPNYGNWETAPKSGGKFMLRLDANTYGASCQYNWCARPNLPDGQATWRAGWAAIIPGTSSFEHKWGSMDNSWNRAVQCEVASVTEPGLGDFQKVVNNNNSKWHRVELELKLNTLAGTPSNATRGNSGFPRSYGDASSPQLGDGFSKVWWTKDLDGTPSPRTLMNHWRNMVCLNRSDNIVTNVGITQFGGLLWFGGTGASFGTDHPCHSWIRKVEIYHYTQDDI